MLMNNPHPGFNPTMELGPQLNTSAPNVTPRDHTGQPIPLANLVGPKGLLLGFIGDIWQQVSVQRIFWLERHAHTFVHTGVNVALLICDEPHTLYGFYVSSLTPPDFPLLADENRDIHRQFSMTLHPGILLLDHNRVIRHKWLVPDDRVWPKIHEIQDTISTL